MEGRDFAPPPHLLAERGALVHRAASRITPTGHTTVQHPGHFQPGKYYPSHIPIPPHSGSGLIGNSSASFMGTFLASSLGSPPSHPAGPPSSPSSPPYRTRPHSTTPSQIWFPHSHEAPGYARFSGSLAPTFLPMSPLDHHGNSSVLYGQRFYDTQKDFYLRGLPSQPHLLSTNHSLPPLSRTAPAHLLESCSRERDSGSAASQKSSKETGVAERRAAPGGKEKEKSKQDSKQDLQHHGPPLHTLHHHHHQHHHSQSLEEDLRHKGDPKHLSSCLLSTKTQNGSDQGATARGSLPSCVGPGASGLGTGRQPGGEGHCCKEGVSGEMRISEPTSECLRHSAMLGHAHPMPYSMPHPLGIGSAVGGSWLHPSHPHHHHPHHPQTDLFCPPPPAPLNMPNAQEKSLAPGKGRDSEVTGPTFVPSVGPLGDKNNGPFQLGNPHCQGIGGGIVAAGGGVGGGVGKETKTPERSSSGSRTAPPAPPHMPPPSSCQRKSSQQQHAYGKADKSSEWPPGPLSRTHGVQHSHNQHSNSVRSCSLDSNEESDTFRPSLPLGTKGGHQAKSSIYASTPPFRDCSHSGLSNRASSEGKGGTESECSLQRNSQRVARIRHQQHGNRGSTGGLEPSDSAQEKSTTEYSRHQTGTHPSWEVRGHQTRSDEEQHKTFNSLGASSQTSRGDQGPLQPLTSPQESTLGPQGPESNAMRNLMKYSSQQPLLFSQKSPFGGLGCLKQGAAPGERSERNYKSSSCALQEAKQILPPRRASSSGENEHSERVGKDSGEAQGEGEVRQPPVGIAVAVARQREPLCRLSDGHPTHSHQSRVMPSMKGVGCPMYPLDQDMDKERKRVCEEQLGLPQFDRERELLLRENKDRVEFTRIHHSSSCHGDLTSHLIMPGSSQLGTESSAHAHSAHHHWMPRTGSPSLWMGHSYGLSHAALHQNLTPGFSTTMPSPLQPVLPLPQDPSTALVVLPTEPAAHPATHHLDVMEQQGLWPSVYGARGPTSHMQHPAVYSRSQFLRQQELYALQQHQHQQHRAAQVMELVHRHSHSQRKPEDSDPGSFSSELRTTKHSKPFSVGPSTKPPPISSSLGGCASRLSPCCRSPAPRSHLKSTPCTPCPEPSPAVTAPRSPALSPHAAPHHLPKPAESQDKRGEGQPPQDYPQSLEPDLPPGYTYPAIARGYKGGPSPQEVQLAEHADLEAEQAEPAEPAPQPLPLSQIGEEPDCHNGVESPTGTPQEVEEDDGVIEAEGEVDDGQNRVTCCPVPLSQTSLCPVTDSTVADPIPDTVTMIPENETSEMEIPAPSEDLKEQDGVLQDPIQGSLTTFRDSQCMEPTVTDPERTVEDNCDSPSNPVETTNPSPPPFLCPVPSALGNQYQGSCIWSLELLIAAALCATRDARMVAPVSVSADTVAPNYGIELLSELAELERTQQQRNNTVENAEEDMLTFDLQSLATLAAARALELAPPITADSVPPLRRILNLRRKCNWTPRPEPVCPVKATMETLDQDELAMRMRLAELQRRYKEKQRELAKLQRKHDHQKEETSRSPARRGPGRPRKRKSTSAPPIPTDDPKKVKSIGVGAGLGLLTEEELAGGGDRKRMKRMSSSPYHHLNNTQMKAHCRPRGRPRLLSTKFKQKACSQLKQKAKVKHGSRLVNLLCHRESNTSNTITEHLSRDHNGNQEEHTHSNKTGEHSDTGSGAAVHQGSDEKQTLMRRGARSKAILSSSTLPTRTKQLLRNTLVTNSKFEAPEKGISQLDSNTEEEDDGIYNSENGAEGIKNLSSKEQLSGASRPSECSIVQLEANQKAKNNMERQGFGSVNVSLSKEEVRMRRKAPCRPVLVSADNNHSELEEGRRLNGPKWREGSREHTFDHTRFLKTSSNPRERATRKTAMLLGKRKSCWFETLCSQYDDITWSRRIRNKQQAKGHAVSRLLQSFAADEGFHMDDDNSFSEGEEEEEEPELVGSALPAPANCTLTKEILRDGLKVLISKEDELLYAAYVHTLDLPDIYSVVVDGERGNRPRVYSLEQLLQEAVLDVQPETVETLTAGTRVCAYWSERSRCLYPGYVRRGGPGEEQKEGSVMVEFDDGDRGWISLSSIRLLPPGYQIHCAEPSPAHLVSPTCRRRKSSTQGKIARQTDVSSERSANAETRTFFVKGKPGRPKSTNSSSKSCMSENVTGTASPLLGWPVAAMSRRKPSTDFFQFNGLTKRALRAKESDMLPLLSSTMATPAKGIFSTSFEVDSFSSIANGCTSFGNQQLTTGLSLGHKNISSLRGRKTADRKEFLVKLDHEGVMSPKTKNGKALLLLGSPEVQSSRGGRMEKSFGAKGIRELTSTMGYSQSVLLVKDAKRNSGHLLKGSSDIRKHSQGLGLSEYADYGPNCHSDCLSSYSDMDEDEDEEEDARRAAMHTTGSFLSRLSVSSSSSGSSSASSSGSLSSSSICSSDNDSSYSSDEEEASQLLLQGCLSTHHRLLQQQQHPEPPTAPPRNTFGAKTMSISNSKAAVNSSTGKPSRRKEIANNSATVVQYKSSKDFPKKQKIPSTDGPPNASTFLPGRQLWKWSGNPTQRRGLKGKARKLFYKAIVRGKDTVRVGDCAVFLSAGRPHLPFIGRIESLWESWSSNMVVKVKWFYHPEETKLGKRHRDGKHALYQSSHEDENDVQTISHKCQVVSRAEYELLSRIRKPNSNSQDLYYLAGTYDPTSGQLVTAEGESIIC
ncbi:BAH and coiled-coil domain-containing protein 1-like isoform X2 [Myxocyprinus asiaticus]|uniref:BAH and coiled-coil domain-containing protein 1-like isoform X2 n=1 Tax=Myxocyprinus asiaticus TaxID=70543 RepID=UPI002223D6F3|nr:BAH and coiled-coil domain-containing protein 1-like isoform X2 [Myxocyprinus asiaticus]